MMLNFDFYAPTRIVFGKDREKEIGELLKPYAKKVLLHYGGGSIQRSGLYDAVTASLETSGIEFITLGGVMPNPRLSKVREGIDLCKRENIDLVLAVGGGSVIDSAKAIAMGVYYDGDIWDAYEGRASIEQAMPVAVILTIPAAGSESSEGSVISHEEKGLKRAFNNRHLRPLLAIMNPELFFTLPPEQLGYGVADMMSHVFERYFTNTTHTDLTDGLCEATLKTLMKNALLAKENMTDYNAWSELGFGGAIAHNGLLGMGRAQDWACHQMEHELSALYDVPHGAGLAVVTPGWMQYVYKENINMFVQFAVNVMGVEGSYRDPEAIALEGIARLQEFFAKMGLPQTMRDLGIGEDRLEEMAKRATKIAFGTEAPLGGFKKLYWQDVLEIYRLVK